MATQRPIYISQIIYRAVFSFNPFSRSCPVLEWSHHRLITITPDWLQERAIQEVGEMCSSHAIKRNYLRMRTAASYRGLRWNVWACGNCGLLRAIRKNADLFAAFADGTFHSCFHLSAPKVQLPMNFREKWLCQLRYWWSLIGFAESIRVCKIKGCFWSSRLTLKREDNCETVIFTATSRWFILGLHRAHHQTELPSMPLTSITGASRGSWPWLCRRTCGPILRTVEVVDLLTPVPTYSSRIRTTSWLLLPEISPVPSGLQGWRQYWYQRPAWSWSTPDVTKGESIKAAAEEPPRSSPDGLDNLLDWSNAGKS